MKQTKHYYDIWRKAAVLGSLWAASEIVLGSFLHNARVPFRGHILTCIGIAVLVAGHRLWPRKGLLWRAGLVCAAMKSVSPSPFILGPMLAIFMEGILLESGLRLTGIRSAGYLFAGGMAMSWAFFQKIGNMLIFYGPDTIALYLKGWEHVRTWLGFPGTSPWLPLIILWLAHFLLGSLAAVLGLRLGQKTCAGPDTTTEVKSAAFQKKNLYEVAVKSSISGHRRNSLTFLILNLIFIISMMALGHKIPLGSFFLLSAVYSIICVSLYPRALAVVKKLSLWSGIFIISVLAGFLLGKIEAGVHMSIRAFVLTIGFAVITAELRNPSIRSWLERIAGAMFFDALEHAFNTLPRVLVSIPSGSEIMRRPVASLRNAIAGAPILLESLEKKQIFIITGGHASGKTSMVQEISSGMRQIGLKPGGICSIGLWRNNTRYGFDVMDILSGETTELCRRNGNETGISTGHFHFAPEGLALGVKALSMPHLQTADVVFVDEVGFLELEGKAWAFSLDILMQEWKKPMVIVVRDYLLEKVCQKWNLKNAIYCKTGQVTSESVLSELTESIRCR